MARIWLLTSAIVGLGLLHAPAVAAKTLQEWQACVEKSEASAEEQGIAYSGGGVLGLTEYAIEVCGYRPTVGDRRLAREDCDRLFGMVGDTECEPFHGSTEDNMFMMTLDRRAFDEVRYWMVCYRIQAGDISLRKEFGREVCGEGTQGKTSEKITAKDWQNHPAIVEIRALYQALIDAKEWGVLRQQQRVFSYCHPNEDVRRVLYTDQEGRPRIYLYEGGSDDSRVNHELYYDNRGQLRFAFITAGAVNGTQIEHRVYFAEDGRKIWEIQKQLEGPGYTFPTEWPDDDLILQPVAAFRAESRCPEEK